MRIWVIAGIALAASTGISLAQDVAAGEQVFRRLCSPCHDVGPEAKTKLGPPLNGIEGRKAGTIEGFNYSEVNKSSGIVWSGATFDKCRCKKCRALACHSSASRMTKTLQTCGPISSNSGPMGRRSDNRVASAKASGLGETRHRVKTRVATRLSRLRLG